MTKQHMRYGHGCLGACLTQVGMRSKEKLNC